MPIGFILYLIAWGLVVTGAQDVWTSVTNRSPEAMTCAEYASGGASSDWLEVSECQVDYLAAVKTYKTGRIDKSTEKDVAYYAPVRPAGVEEGPVALVVKAPADVVPMLEEMFAADAADAESGGTAVEQFLERNAAKLVLSSVSLSGLRQFGVHADSEVRGLLEGAAGFELPAEWSLLEVGARPAGIGPSVSLIALALIYIGWRTLAFLGRSQAQAAADAETNAPAKISDLAGPPE
jgi:hypothetical protein